MNFFTKKNRVQNLLLKQEILSGLVLLLLIYAIIWIANIYFSIHRGPANPTGELFFVIFKQCSIPFSHYLVICSFLVGFQILIRIIFPRWNRILGNIEQKINSDWEHSIQNGLIIQIGPITILDNWFIFQAFRDIVFLFSKPVFLAKEDLIWVYSDTKGIWIWDRWGNSCITSSDLKTFEEFAKYLSKNMPWVYVGYDQKRYLRWIENISPIVQEVDQRKVNYLERSRPESK